MKEKTIKENIRRISISFIFLVITLESIFIYSYTKKNDIVTEKFDPFTSIGKFQKYTIAYNDYKKTSPLEMHIRWLKLFYLAKYKSGGNPNFSEYDCLSAVCLFINSYGGNVKLEEIPKIRKRLVSLDTRVRHLDKIKPRDIIIFRPVYRAGRNIWHIAIVAEVRGNKIFYMEVSANSQTWGFRHTYIQNKKISGLFSMSLGFFMGDFLKNIKE